MRDGLAETLIYACIPLALAVLCALLLRLKQILRPATGTQRASIIPLYRLPLLLALGGLLLGVGLSVDYAERARRTALEDAQQRFLHQTEQVEAGLQEQINRLGNMLDGVRGLLLARPGITRQEFRHYMQARDPNLKNPGVRGMGFIARVPSAAVPGFVAQQRRGGAVDYQLRNNSLLPQRYIIEYLEPESDNAPALGYDIGAEPLRRAAADAAMHSGRASLSQRITLVQDPMKRPAFLFLLPVYEGTTVPEGAAERERQLRGWVYAPLVLSELMAGVTGFDADMSNSQLFEGLEPSADNLLYDSLLPDGAIDAPESMARAQNSRFSITRPILLADQVLYMRTNSSPAFEASFLASGHLGMAVLGSSLSLLLAMVLWLLMAGRAHALDLAQRMTKDLDRLAMVARRSSNAVFFVDTEWRITWINEGFTRLSGYSAREAMGCQPGTLLQAPYAEADLAAQQDAGRRQQIQQRNKRGVDYWVDMEVLSLRGADDRLTGYMVVQSDITEELRAKAALEVEKERADSILTGANVGTWESNRLTGEQRWNDCWSAMMGFCRADVVPDMDQFWQSRLHPLDQERLGQAMAHCLAGGSDSYSCEVRVRRKDGQWMWILSRAKVMSRLSGAVEWLGGIHTDITDIKQVELSLREMEAFLDRAGRIAGVGAWQIDLQTRAVVFSAQTCAIHGMAPDFQPSEEVALSFYPPHDRQRLQDAMQLAQAQGTPWDLVLEFFTAQGEQRWVRIFGELAFDENGPLRLVGAFQDVTSDQLARQEVERSGALLRGAIEAINEAFVLYDPQDRLVFCNDKYRAIYAMTADMMVPGAQFESIIRAGAERGQYLDAIGRVDAWVAERMQAHLDGKESMEQRLSDGRWLKIIERRMPDGHRVGFRVDISELKLATAAAEHTSAMRGEEQRRMQAILEGTHVGTWEWNIQTNACIYNEQYAAMLGYALSEWLPLSHQNWTSRVHPDDLPVATQMMDAHLRGERPGYEVEMRMRHKQGHWIWVLSKGRLAQRSEDGLPLWIYGTHMDVTERKQAEQALAQTSATLQNVLDSATAVGVLTLDLEQRIRIFNKGAENLLGYAADALLDQPCAHVFFDGMELDALGQTLELAWGHSVTQQQALAHVVTIREPQEWTLVRQDGSRFKASLIFSSMLDAQGSVAGRLGVIYDISRQKEYESSLRDAMRLAEQSSVAKSQFLANMSHEIRTPMNAILGMLQLLRTTTLSSTQHDYTDKAVGAARSLLGLLNDILDFSKVEAGRMQLHNEPFALETLLGDLSVILSSNLGNKPVDLRFEVDPELPAWLMGDAMRLKQILINLGGNAVKFTERGEVVLRWTLLARTAERIKVAITVVDTGIGIAPENQARIFNAFTQAEANTTRRFGGTGLGLVISTRLIRLMGGELQLSSVLGEGSSFGFSLELPVVEPAALALADGDTPHSARPHVLLVDDHAAALDSAARMLRSRGWQVDLADSGAAAVAWLAARQARGEPPPQALFVDADMPDMDGAHTLQQVRALYAPGQPPLLILLTRQTREAHAAGHAGQQIAPDAVAVRPLTCAMFAAALAQAQRGPQASAEVTRPAQQRRLSGMRVLLVEDNAINQQVAQELLRAEGAEVAVADNGALGVTAVQDAVPPFDLVLMDLQMPVMDGLSATRMLRAEPRFAALPIIAMTANAMVSDRDECLAAGMNDHIGKPFDLGQLVDTLLAHTGRAAPSTGAATPLESSAPANHRPAPSSNWPEGIDVEAALVRMGGNRPLMQRTVVACVAEARQLAEQLGMDLADVPLAPLQRQLHAFKGLAGTLGAAAMAQQLADAERQLRGASPQPGWQAALESARAQLLHHVPLLEQVALQLQGVAQPATVRLPDTLRPQLQALLEALQAGDMQAMELHAQLRNALDERLAEVLEPLDLAMAELEFEQAALACAHLLEQLTMNEAHA